MIARALFLAVALGAGVSALTSAPPNAGDSMGQVRLDIYSLADGGYSTILARGWFLPDGGLDTLPNLDPSLVVTSWVKTGPCASVLICLGYDGGVDPVSATTAACGCSTGSNCSVTNPDGGANMTAPLGVTLATGTYDGGGCQAKACVELFRTGASSWPATCPGGT